MMTIIASNLGSGRSRKRSELLLDQFLNRIGNQTWGGYLSKEGLKQLVQELKSGATRNTAVQIIHEHAHRFETIALIGNRKRFSEGLVSVGRVLKRQSSATPQMIKHLRRITEVAALWHDAGKVYEDFQRMVRDEFHGKHGLRHFAVSYFGYRAWLESGRQQLKQLEFTPGSANWSQPGGALAADVAAAVVLTHHGKTGNSSNPARFVLPSDRFGEALGRRRPDSEEVDFSSIGHLWSDAVTRKQQALDDLPPLPPGAQSLAFYVSRAAMMLADHAQSAFERTGEYQGAKHDTPRPGVAYAKSSPFIPLEDHLLGVMRLSGSAIGAFLSHEWPSIDRRPAALSQRPAGHFAWQSAAESAIADRQLKEGDGFFGVIIAETGTGKTQGGYRIMNALAGGRPRYTLALGFGALAVQSGIEYRSEIGLDQEECAIFVGRRHAAAKRREEEKLKGNDQGVDVFNFEMLSSIGTLDHRLPDAITLSTTDRERRLLSTPVVSMTVDHIIAAMEADRGSFVTAALRVATADLLIDEIDSFSIAGIHCLGRLIYVSGLYGRKVVISSATTTPEIAEGLFRAYRSGYQQHQRLSGRGRLFAGVFSNRGKQASVAESADISAFKDHYLGFVNDIAREIQSDAVHRCKMTSFSASPADGQPALFDSLLGSVMEMARAHASPLHAISQFATGFVRFNLIRNAQQFTLWLAENHQMLEQATGWRIRINYYGATLDSKSRQFIEGKLGQILNRKTEKWTEVPELRSLQSEPRPTLFLLITTPLIEVGRDYDFDFAILEPCSDMSIIQSAGRVLRHRRSVSPGQPNVALMPFSCRSLPGSSKGQLYGRPGPGVEQVDPVTEDTCRLPRKPAAELFGLPLYGAGIHAGHRISRAVTESDRLERQLHTSVLLSGEDLSLQSFHSHESPYRDTRFDEITLREQESRYEYIYRDGAFELSSDLDSVAVPQISATTEACWLLRPRLLPGTRLNTHDMLTSEDVFSPQLGLYRNA